MLRIRTFSRFATLVLLPLGAASAATVPFEPLLPSSMEECQVFSQKWELAIESAKRELSACEKRDGGTVYPKGVWMPNCRERLQAFVKCASNADRLCEMRTSMKNQVSACFSAVAAVTKAREVQNSPQLRSGQRQSIVKSEASEGSAEYRAAAQLSELANKGLIPIELANSCGKLLAYATKNMELLRGLKNSEQIFGTVSNVLKSGAIANMLLAGDDDRVWHEIMNKILDDSICASRAICPGWMAGRTIGSLINEASRALSADRRSWNDRITDSAYDQWSAWRPRSAKDLEYAVEEARTRIQMRSTIDYSSHICRSSNKD